MSFVYYAATRKIRSAYVPVELVSIGGFDSDTIWVKGAGWTIVGGLAIGAAGVASDLEQDITVTQNLVYNFTVTTSAITGGNITPKIAGTLGAAITANGTYTQEIIAGAGLSPRLEITKSSTFAGSIDNVSVVMGTNSFELNVPMPQYSSSPMASRQSHVAISGTGQTVIARNFKRSYTVTSMPIIVDSAIDLQWQEFLNSTREGESFLFDPVYTATYASPSSKLATVRMDDGDWTESYSVPFYIQYSFTCVEI